MPSFIIFCLISLLNLLNEYINIYFGTFKGRGAFDANVKLFLCDSVVTLVLRRLFLSCSVTF